MSWQDTVATTLQLLASSSAMFLGIGLIGLTLREHDDCNPTPWAPLVVASVVAGSGLAVTLVVSLALLLGAV